ncbi:mannitol dehydrogenase family protein [Algibacillus agarilyticus]|uniref:mannitol dehydrogenase family protein n=1 Tax=Algibacillus agarilyticus TaxID=2234133 RepID=UPI000DCF763B|nr:mannitol dehydrogenase family protein [Algibacillus agarilyticus]
MNKLNLATLNDIDACSIPNYRLTDQNKKVGLVHIGPGAFFRGHQAWYTHQAITQYGGDWLISAVSMRSAGVSEALTEQDGLYSVAVLDSKTEFEIIGSIKEVLIATTEFDKVFARLTHQDTQFVTLTITEKGYCLDSKGTLDLDNKEIKQDLTGTLQPITAVGMLANALLDRYNNNLPAFCVISCDNLTDNGHKLRAALISYAKQLDEKFTLWLEENLIAPCTMVDSITPATDDALRTLISTELNVSDNWPIKRESFVQWVIEDTLPKNRPAWDKVGATLTSDVRGFENAKLRLLNCPHSTLAYIGVLLGHETVYDAMQDQGLVSFITNLINSEVIPSFTPPKELDVQAYSQDILARFKNPAIRHLLAQIAWDGSQKLPMRILPIIEQNIADDNAINGLGVAVAAWCLFIRKRYINNEELVDPLQSDLLKLAAECNNDAAHDIALFVGFTKVFSTNLLENKQFKVAIEQGYTKLLPLLSNDGVDFTTI